MPEIRVSTSPSPANYSPAVAIANGSAGNPARSVAPGETSPAHSPQPSTASPPAACGGNTNAAVAPGVAALIESRPDVALAQFRATQLRNQPAAAAQQLIDAQVRELGMTFAKPPRYDATLTDFGATDSSGQVTIGPAALAAGIPALRSTLIHEQVHVQQVETDNWARYNTTAGNVNELEAYRAELLQVSVERSGLSKAEQVETALKYEERLGNLERQGSVGDHYLREVLIRQNFTLRPRDVEPTR